jgi:hypothetical protein
MQGVKGVYNFAGMLSIFQCMSGGFFLINYCISYKASGNVGVAFLKSLLSDMPFYSGLLPELKPLGYRGCFLRFGSPGEWFAWGCVVTMKSSAIEESRSDMEGFSGRLLPGSARRDCFRTRCSEGDQGWRCRAGNGHAKSISIRVPAVCRIMR